MFLPITLRLVQIGQNCFVYHSPPGSKSSRWGKKFTRRRGRGIQPLLPRFSEGGGYGRLIWFACTCVGSAYTHACAQGINHFGGIYPKKSRGFPALFSCCGSYDTGSATPHGGTSGGLHGEAQCGQPLWLLSCLHAWRTLGRRVRGPADPLSAVTIQSAALCRTCARMPMPGAGAWACDPDSIHPQSAFDSLDVGTFSLVCSQKTSRNAKEAGTTFAAPASWTLTLAKQKRQHSNCCTGV